MARILITPARLDYDPTEVAIPWLVLTNAGHEVDFATADGARARPDEIILSGQGLDPWAVVPAFRGLRLVGRILGADENARRAHAQLEEAPGFVTPRRFDALNPEDWDALVLPGGHRARGIRPYLENLELRAFVAAMFGAGKPVGAICHGTVVAARAVVPGSNCSVLFGRKTTSLTWAQERLATRIARITRFWDPSYYRTYVEEPGEPRGYRGVQAEVTRALAAPDDYGMFFDGGQEPDAGPLLVPSTAAGTSDGTLSQSVDGTLLYAVSADDNELLVVDPTGNTCPNLPSSVACIVASVQVGTQPARVIVGADDTIYVSNRKSRSIAVIPRPQAGGSWAVATTLPTDAEPLGMALSPGTQTTLYVVNHASGTVEAFDLATSAVVWDTTVGNFPRSVAALSDGELYVSHYRSGMVDMLDAATGVVLKSVSASVGVVPNLTQATTQKGTVFQPTFSPVAMDSLVVSPDGRRVYLAHRRERSGIISDVSFPPIVAPAITTFETSTDLPHDDALETSQTYPPTILFPENRTAFITGFTDAGLFIPPEDDAGLEDGDGGGGGGGTPGYGGVVAGFGWTQAPIAMVEDNQGEYLFVANQDSDNVTVLPASRRSGSDAPGGINSEVSVDEGPNGLALSPDNLTLYVYNAIGKSISVVVAQFGQAIETNRIIGVGDNGPLGSDAVAGRQLFYSAASSQMAAPGSGVACESCHLEAGTDGHVWQFVWGPRKTQGLLGRDIAATAPYHWDGTELQMSNLLQDTITVRMGGSGIDATQETQIGAFLAQLEPADNPNQLSTGLSASQLNGQVLFLANCASCHPGADMTDNGFHNVGTLVTMNPNGNPDDPCRLGVGYVAGTSCLTDTPLLQSIPNPGNDGGFNTPTVLGLYFAPPYFHDGSAATLEDLIPRMLSGIGLSALSASDTADLVAYLQSL